MIAFLRGSFVRKTPALVLVDVNGVGYEVHISLNTYSSIAGLDQGILHTYLQIREDAHLLYGFFEESEKEMFIQLIGVSGVGSSTARMMLSAMKPDEIARAIIQGNARQLESIKGIGKKSAERIILELRDKVGKTVSDLNIGELTGNRLDEDALNALISLGIARPTAEQAISRVRKSDPTLYKIEDLIKQALKNI
ncbi:MAG TPA: Holliday junction branch migration protein RuvA [Flavitalea sp.]|nr:Holliday junction branch migration protein RuvA [Flavitalea sp.]